MIAPRLVRVGPQAWEFKPGGLQMLGVAELTEEEPRRFFTLRFHPYPDSDERSRTVRRRLRPWAR